MRLPWRSKGKSGESEKALREAQKHVQEAQNHNNEVSEIVESLREFRHRNHFAEQLERIILRGGGR